MYLLVVLLICFVLICWIVLTLIHRYPSVKKENPKKPKSSKASARNDNSEKPKSSEAHLRTTSSVIHKRNVSLSSDSISEDIETKNYKNTTVKDVSLEQNEPQVDNNDKGEESGRVMNETFDLDFDKFRSFVDKENLIKELAKGRVLRRLNQYIKDSINKWKQIKLNIAVTGNSGAGKSSLINALRELKPSDEGAAGVGVVETTTFKTPYPYPQNPHVVLWDLPGVGTQKFTKDQYLDEMEFESFEVVIIVSAGRFLENDIWLSKQMRGLRKNVIFVRTKVDIDIMNAKRDTREKLTEEKCLTEIRTDLTTQIKAERIPDSGVFLVSSPDRTKYDFPALDKKIKGFLNIKGIAIRALVQKLVKKAIRDDQHKNKNEFIGRKIVSILYGFFPIPKLESAIGNLSVSQMRDICLEKFCIDEGSLEEVATELKMSTTLLKSKLTSYRKNVSEDSHQDSTEKKNWSTFRRYSKYLLPVVGSFLSAYKTYDTTEKCLKEMCDIMADDELILAIHLLDRIDEELTPIQ